MFLNLKKKKYLKKSIIQVAGGLTSPGATGWRIIQRSCLHCRSVADLHPELSGLLELQDLYMNGGFGDIL